MTVWAPAAVLAARVSRMVWVPVAKGANSHTPGVPVNRTVRDARMAPRNSSWDWGPQSIPSHPAGIPSSQVKVRIKSGSDPLPKSRRQAQSRGKTTSTPRNWALSSTWDAMSAALASNSDFPIPMPKHVFMNRYARPPQTMRRSTRSIRCAITCTLSTIRAPPTMAVTGRWSGEGSRTSRNAASSACTSGPARPPITACRPTVEEWAWWAMLKASKT
mmetsp:Transcript_43635/g.78507  ORF Transcript_43635/g.78507 Transcript_43635/m.78507 type:complete len:217 (-) Transcript_43635:58-708(-)